MNARLTPFLSIIALFVVTACGAATEATLPTAESAVGAVEPNTTATAEQPATVVPSATTVPTATTRPAATASPTAELLPTATAVSTAAPTQPAAPSPEATPAATSEGAVTLQINADGSGDLPTLEEAIAFAAGGSTVELSAGDHYVEQMLAIDRPLTIKGAGQDLTSIISRAPAAAVLYTGDGLLAVTDVALRHEGDFAADVVNVQSGALNLANCRLEGGARSTAGANFGAGLFTANDSQVEASNCQFLNNQGLGIEALHNSQINIKDSVVSANEAGILFDGNSSGLITGSEITGNRDIGILVFALARPQIIGNLIQDNLGFGIRYQLDDGVGGVVQGNELLNNNSGGPGASGTNIIVFDSFAPHLIDNTCLRGEGLAAAPGLNNSADPSGIVFFETGVNQLDTLVLQGNQCAVAFCGLAPGAEEFVLQCESGQ